jgi:tRNA1Val (adenine37-N6)-methyltransferase
MAFRFRHFIVEDDRSTMRIGTDAMLLGACARVGNAASILDIGTGCGVLALMAAQRSTAVVHAIDTDSGSAAQAQQNFTNSPWPDRLTAFYRSLEDHAALEGSRYDVILSNPPFFSGSLRSPSDRRNLARHLNTDDISRFLQDAATMMNPGGFLWLILPAPETAQWTRHAVQAHLYPGEWIRILPGPGRDANRMIICFSEENPVNPAEGNIVIRDGEGRFTEQYLGLTREFHCFQP